MNQQDRLYQVQKNTDKEEDRQMFKKVKYEVDCKIKSSHNSYLDSLVGIIDDSDPIEISCPSTKKLFFISQKCRQDGQGSAPLKEYGQVCTDNDAGNYSQNMSQPPDDTRNKYPNMPNLKI